MTPDRKRSTTRMTARFARTAAATGKLRRYSLCSAVFWLILSVFLVQNTATSGAGRSQSSQTQVPAIHRSLQLTATVISQEYCRNTEMQRSQMDLKLKLSLKNIGNATLIFCRYCNGINRVVLSKSLKKAKSGDYIYDQHSTFMRMPWLEKDGIQVSPTLEFVTLEPGESFDYEYPQSADITLTDADNPSQDVPPARYLMYVKIQIWQWDSDLIKPLEQRWARLDRYSLGTLCPNP
jgi:hypothetical protein